MVLYECITCNFSSKIKSHYNRHLKTKKHLRNIEISLSPMVKTQKDPKRPENCEKKTQKDPKRPKKDPKFTCDFCESSFSTYAHKRRHELHRCKENKESFYKILYQQSQNEKKEFLAILEKERMENKKQIELLLSKVGNTTNIQNNIQLNSYGNEDLSHLNNKLLDSLVKIPYGMIPKMIEAVHFNDEKPENKNIMLPNKNDNKIKIFRNNKWIYKNKEDVINDLIDGKSFIMDTYYDNNQDNFKTTTITNYSKFKEIFNNADKELLEKIKNDCELIMLNNR